MPACLRSNAFEIRERPSVDRGERGPRGEDRSGPALCARCGARFWSWDLSQCFDCDDCRRRPPVPTNSCPRSGGPEDDEAWNRRARVYREAEARACRGLPTAIDVTREWRETGTRVAPHRPSATK